MEQFDALTELHSQTKPPKKNHDGEPDLDDDALNEDDVAMLADDPPEAGAKDEVVLNTLNTVKISPAPVSGEVSSGDGPKRKSSHWQMAECAMHRLVENAKSKEKVRSVENSSVVEDCLHVNLHLDNDDSLQERRFLHGYLHRHCHQPTHQPPSFSSTFFTPFTT